MPCRAWSTEGISAAIFICTPPRPTAKTMCVRWRGRRRRLASRRQVGLEISCQVDRLDLSDVNARLARDRGAPIVISTDAHSRSAFGRLRWGVLVARRAWLSPAQVLNTKPFDEFRAALRRNRR